MAITMTVVVELKNGEKLTLSNVNARFIPDIEDALIDEDCHTLEIRNMDNPKKSIEFFKRNVKELRFE